MQHMDEGLLQAWLDGPRAGLTEEERTEVEAHLDQCSQCLERVEALRAAGRRALELLAVVEGEVDDEIPDFAAVVRRAGELGGESEKEAPASAGTSAGARVDPETGPEAIPEASRRAGPWWGRRTAWAASILVALGAGWLANEWNATMPDVRLDPLQVTEAPASGESAADVALEAGLPEGAAPESGALDPSAVPALANRAEAAGEAGLVANDRPPVLADASLVPVEAPSAISDAGAAAAERRVVDSPQTREVAARASGLVPPPAEPDPVVQLDPTPVPRGGEIPEAERFAGTVPTGLDDLDWRPSSLGEARSRLGAGVGTVPDLPVASVRIGTFDGVPVVRVEHELGDGALLTLLQARTMVAPGDADLGTTTELPGGVFVRGWADIPVDSLRALLGRVRAN